MPVKSLLLKQQENLDRLRRSARWFTRRVVARGIVNARARLALIPGDDHGGWTWSSEQAVYTQLELALEELIQDSSSGMINMHRVSARRGFKDMKKFLKQLDRMSGAVRPLRFDLLGWLSKEEEFLINKFQKSLRRYGRATSNAMRESIAESVLVGETWAEATKKLQKIIPSHMKKKRWMVERIARTEMASAYNGVTHAALVEEDAPDDPMMKKLVATFDGRTGADSRKLHGQTVPVKQPFTDVNGASYMHPPNRPNDREVIVGWRKSYDEFLPDFDDETAL